ncbi:hypothetical protein Metal_3345 [Methylomicrobium album BG8]|uniref:Uncharacterized protein n=1 Tax=Methylomicrobium album BG8 TaxID=686340 RepID=H8GQ68_METAL|nr:hypothetical protein Metal_3345 [Methylomicrobium album BG8]
MRHFHIASRGEYIRLWCVLTGRMNSPLPKTCQVLKTWQVYPPFQEVNIGQILKETLNKSYAWDKISAACHFR